MSAFRVVHLIPVTTWKEVVLLETDDGMEAEVAAHDWRDTHSGERHAPTVTGRDASHDWPTPSPGYQTGCRCQRCGSWDDGSYGSHMPCGWDSEGLALVVLMNRWRAQHRPTQLEEYQ